MPKALYGAMEYRGYRSAFFLKCRTIQNQLEKHQHKQEATCTDSARLFALLVTGDKLSSAQGLLEKGGCGGVLDLEDDINGETVRDILKAKHPPAATIEQSTVITGTPHP